MRDEPGHPERAGDSPEAAGGGPSAEAVRAAARLARIEVTPEQAQALRHDLRGLLDQAAHLADLPLDGVEPMAIACQGENRWTRDEPNADPAFTDGESGVDDDPGGPEAAWRRNMPDRAGPFFRVPRVVDGAS